MGTKLNHTCSCGDSFTAEADDHAGLGILRMQYIAFKSEHEKCGKKGGPTFIKELTNLAERLQAMEDHVFPRAYIQSDPGTPNWQTTISGVTYSGTGGGGGSSTSTAMSTLSKEAFRQLMMISPQDVPLFEKAYEKAVKEGKAIQDYERFKAERRVSDEARRLRNERQAEELAALPAAKKQRRKVIRGTS